MTGQLSTIEVMQTVFLRDLHLAIKQKTDTLGAVFFFALVASLFPLAIGSELQLLKQIAPGIIWVSALLASMLSMNRLYTNDFNDGTLEQLTLSACPLEFIVLAKILAHWTTTGFVLLILSPILAIQFDLSPLAIRTLMLTLLIGTPVLSFLGSIGAALSLGLQSAGALISLMILPLLIPVLILGTLAVDAASTNMPFSVYLYLLLALSILASFFGPLASAFALRIAQE